MDARKGYIYILTNKNNTVLYTGVTSNLSKRIFEHRQKLIDGFTRRYHATKLVYYDAADSMISAIAREKQIKGWLRVKKIRLIESLNPGWNDLYDKIA